MNKHESKEDYLERILMLSERNENKIVRAIDVSKDLGYSKPSVSIALKKLKESGYVLVDDNTGAITLTDSGRIIAEKVYERHILITKCLIAIGVDESVAEEDACKIEHELSDQTFEKLKEHINK